MWDFYVRLLVQTHVWTTMTVKDMSQIRNLTQYSIAYNSTPFISVKIQYFFKLLAWSKHYAGLLGTRQSCKTPRLCLNTYSSRMRQETIFERMQNCSERHDRCDQCTLVLSISTPTEMISAPWWVWLVHLDRFDLYTAPWHAWSYAVTCVISTPWMGW